MIKKIVFTTYTNRLNIENGLNMYVKVPDVNHCCFCLPLRPGIILFAYINILFSILAVTCLIITTELQRATITRDASSVEAITSTILFSILGMGIILNILLLVAGYQKDISMLRLYNYYAVATALAALIPSAFLLSREMFIEVTIALAAIAMQCYVIVLVRSEVVKLEEKQLVTLEEIQANLLEQVDVSDRVTLVSEI
ncbi:jg9911 [Pararge aegeria aegeria]|uniref:Jg9911 protein n=1 Tax=Pararge aegeria aegeria TaxID=348720 RepID=A0A8S4RDY1_9NEOP|nr:jg9911 [Pararge aegeria aegeria]